MYVCVYIYIYIYIYNTRKAGWDKPPLEVVTVQTLRNPCRFNLYHDYHYHQYYYYHYNVYICIYIYIYIYIWNIYIYIYMDLSPPKNPCQIRSATCQPLHCKTSNFKRAPNYISQRLIKLMLQPDTKPTCPRGWFYIVL